MADEDEDPAPWQRFSHWIHSLCVVTFDLELGQALEVLYPGDALLSAQEKANICYLAFPDSNCGQLSDTNFYFRIRRQTPAQSPRTDSQLPAVLTPDPLHFFGFVHFRQQKDASIPRGYFQKSLVLLTSLPFFNLFTTAVDKIALSYFDMGEPAIEAACHDIDHWPRPEASAVLSLPLLGQVIHCRVPCKSDVPLAHKLVLSEKKEDSKALVLPSIHETDLFKALGGVLNHIQLLWELVLIGEPLLVLSPSPEMSSSLVQALVSLISPLRYAHDYRPFFTIHDSEFKEFCSAGRPPARVILGVTNPFFIKALQHWPHIIKVGSALSDAAPAEKTRRHWDGRTLDSKPGLYTHYKPFLKTDKVRFVKIENMKKQAFVAKLLKGGRPDGVESVMLRRHFLELTQSFMIPLERHLSSLMPLRKQMSPFNSVPQARPFLLEEFLSSLDDTGPSLTCGVKGDWRGLYTRFVSSLTFSQWLASRADDVRRHLRSLHLDVLCNADFGPEVLASKQQVEVVDLVLKLRERLQELEPQSERRSRLNAQINAVLSSVDDELKALLMSNCALREVVL